MKKRFITIAVAMLLSSASMFAQGNTAKLSPYLQQVIQEQASVRRAAANTPVTVLAKLADGADEQALAAQYDFEVLNRIGRILIIRIPFGNITAMSEDAAVVRIEAERAPRPMMELVPGQVKADLANNGLKNQLANNYTGEGVVVGIVDAGFDYINPFFDVYGTKRTGTVKTPRIKWAADYPVSKKYTTQEDIVAAQHSSDATDVWHGTHVAGIAAGSVVNNTDDVTLSGIAPQSDIALACVDLVQNNDQTVRFDQSLQAFADIFAYAKEQGKPCVINYSAGDAMSFSAHRQLAEEGIRTLLQEPGRALVVAAGNSGSTMRYGYKPASLEEGGVAMQFDGSGTSNFAVEVKMKSSQTLQLTYSGTTTASFTGAELEGKTSFSLGTVTVTVTMREKHDDYEVFYLTAGNKVFTASEDIYVTVKGDGEAWMYANTLCAGFKNVPLQGITLAQEGYSMAWPACMPEVITVGNIAHRFKILTMVNKYSGQGPTDLTAIESTKGEGYLAKSSSVGPTLADATKPDVCAPGVNIVSACNNYVSDAYDNQIIAWTTYILDTQENDGYYFTLAQTGTSMSAPVVTGTVALWMQADPTLTTEKIKDIIAHSSRQPDDTMTYPNNQYGYGEIDAYEGLKYIESLTGIENITNDSSSKREGRGYYMLDGRRLANQPTAKGLYIVNGKKVILK